MIYINSGLPFYDGLTFATGGEALILIRDRLSSWSAIADNIPDDLTMQGTTFNGHSCYIQFAINGNSLEVRNSYNNSQLSEPLSLEFIDGETNKLWLGFDNDSGYLVVRDRYQYQGAIYFGFPERFNASDKDCYLIAKLNSRQNDAIIAKAKHTGVVNHRIGDDFYKSDEFSSEFCNGGYQGVFDLCTIKNPYSTFLNSAKRNAGFYAHTGQVNKTNDRPVISKIFYLEGRGSVDNYSTTKGNPLALYNRGYLKHVAKGFGKLEPGRIEKGGDGKTYLVVGGDGWQAVEVDSEVVTPQAEPTAIFRKSISFATVDNAIAEIQNTLTSAGWNILSFDNTEITLQATHSNGNSNCYFRFAKVGANTIEVQGDLLGDKTKLSPSLTFSASGTNQLTETANSQAAAISFNNEGGFWLGFLRQEGQGEGLDPVWGLGLIKDGVEETYIAVDGKWVNIAQGYTVDTDQRSSYPVHNSDRLTTASTPIKYYENPDPRNSAYMAHNGQVNGATGQVQLGCFIIISGATSAIAYGIAAQGDQNAPKQSYHGVVEFVCDGMRSLNGGSVKTEATGAQYMSVGGTGWNGMQIK